MSERTGEEGELRDYEVVNKWVEGVERTDFGGIIFFSLVVVSSIDKEDIGICY